VRKSKRDSSSVMRYPRAYVRVRNVPLLTQSFRVTLPFARVMRVAHAVLGRKGPPRNDDSYGHTFP
jgi:hypothetical protein